MGTGCQLDSGERPSTKAYLSSNGNQELQSLSIDISDLNTTLAAWISF